MAAQVLTAAQQAGSRLAHTTSPVLAPATADLRAQLSGLVYPGFIAETGTEHLPDVARYLRAISVRLDKAPEDPGRDAERMAAVQRVTGACQRAMKELPAAAREGADARAVRWLIEEFRVSLFAQTLGTRGPVSEKRIQAALDRLTQR
jgi:ATP-dependent helicase HrpA